MLTDIKISRELVKIANILLGMKFKTKKEMEEYKKTHDVKPGTKLEVEETEENGDKSESDDSKGAVKKIKKAIGDTAGKLADAFKSSDGKGLGGAIPIAYATGNIVDRIVTGPWKMVPDFLGMTARARPNSFLPLAVGVGAAIAVAAAPAISEAFSVAFKTVSDWANGSKSKKSSIIIAEEDVPDEVVKAISVMINEAAKSKVVEKFIKDGKIDEEALKKFLKWHKEEKQ
jgi:hypothetical protein